MPDNNKIAIFAGGGRLPQMLIDKFVSEGRSFSLFLLEGQDYDNDYSSHNPSALAYGQVGKFIDILKQQNVKELVFVGGVTKPNFSQLKVDKKAAALITKILASKILGDDAVLRAVVKFFEKEGFKVIEVNKFLTDLVSRKGVLSKTQPKKSDLNDIKIAMKAMKKMSEFDIGQSVVLAQRQIIAVEGPEGTDNMIARCSDLTLDYKKEAILVKMKKVNQSKKADLPTIGVDTVNNCHKSQIKGIAVKAGSTLILEKDKVVNLVDELGMFLVVV